MTKPLKANTMNFLIVDDADNMRRSIRAMLKLINFGKNYYEADNGRTAWRFLEKGEIRIDFIISDLHMPHMNGTELLHRIRSVPKLRDIPFLMITAEANQEVVAEAAEHDVDAYLTKPFVTASLEQKITELLRQAAQPSPQSLLLKKARELEDCGELDGAITEAKKALALNIQASRPLRELGRLFVKKGDLKSALSCFQKAIEANRLDVSSYHYLGQIFYRLGKIDQATDYFSKAMRISPRHADRALHFSKLLLQQKNYKEADKVLKLLLRNLSGDIDLKEEIAETCREHGFHELAVKTYRDVLKADPERFYLHKYLGIALLKDGQLNEAIEVLEKAVEKFPEDLEILLPLAESYFQLKMPVRADKWASRALRIDPQNRQAREIMNKCL